MGLAFHREWSDCRSHSLLASRAIEVFVQREERMRFEFPKCPPELLLNAVHLVKKGAPVDFQSIAAELPVGAQQKMKFENFVGLVI